MWFSRGKGESIFFSSVAVLGPSGLADVVAKCQLSGEAFKFNRPYAPITGRFRVSFQFTVSFHTQSLRFICKWVTTKGELTDLV